MSTEDNTTEIPEINEEYNAQNEEEQDNDTSEKRTKRAGRSIFGAIDRKVDEMFELSLLLFSEIIWLLARLIVMAINHISPIKVSARLTDSVARLEAMLESLRQGHDKKLDGKTSKALEKFENKDYHKKIQEEIAAGKLDANINVDKEAQKRCSKDINRGMWKYRTTGITSSVWRGLPKGVRGMVKDLKRMTKSGATNEQFLAAGKQKLRELEKQSKFLKPTQETQKKDSKRNTKEMEGGGAIPIQPKPELPKEETAVQQQAPTSGEEVVENVTISKDVNYLSNNSVSEINLETTEKVETTAKTTTKRKLGGG